MIDCVYLPASRKSRRYLRKYMFIYELNVLIKIDIPTLAKIIFSLLNIILI